MSCDGIGEHEAVCIEELSYAPQPQPPLGLGKYTKSCIISLAFLILG